MIFQKNVMEANETLYDVIGITEGKKYNVGPSQMTTNELIR